MTIRAFWGKPVNDSSRFITVVSNAKPQSTTTFVFQSRAHQYGIHSAEFLSRPNGISVMDAQLGTRAICLFLSAKASRCSAQLVFTSTQFWTSRSMSFPQLPQGLRVKVFSSMSIFLRFFNHFCRSCVKLMSPDPTPNAR